MHLYSIFAKLSTEKYTSKYGADTAVLHPLYCNNKTKQKQTLAWTRLWLIEGEFKQVKHGAWFSLHKFFFDHPQRHQILVLLRKPTSERFNKPVAFDVIKLK